MSPKRPGIRDTVGRFSDRVEHYVRFRPHYPAALRSLLEREYGWTPSLHVADIGSGTGILSALFLRAGHRVTGVEPNQEMRAAGERYLEGFKGFTSCAGTAEHSGLLDASVDAIVAGQAAHWFDLQRTRAEFRRILKPDGWVMLVWNERPAGADPFLEAYDCLLRVHGTDYEAVEKLRPGDEALTHFLGARSFRRHVLANEQALDLEGLKGRILSSSYAPAAGHPKHAPMMEAIEELFREHQRDGAVTVTYDCRVYLGRLDD